MLRMPRSDETSHLRCRTRAVCAPQVLPLCRRLRRQGRRRDIGEGADNANLTAPRLISPRPRPCPRSRPRSPMLSPALPRLLQARRRSLSASHATVPFTEGRVGRRMQRPTQSTARRSMSAWVADNLVSVRAMRPRTRPCAGAAAIAHVTGSPSATRHRTAAQATSTSRYARP